MAISQIIQNPKPDKLVSKFPDEEFNATSQLIVDDPYWALLVVNGQSADLFSGGRHTLSVPNLPLLKRIISIPTDGRTPFRCKVFYISRVHQMDMLWGTQGPITLDDPIYDIILHVMLHGSMTFSIEDPRKFLIKLVGFREFTSDEMLKNFRGIVSAHVKDNVSKIMINQKKSYFEINANLFELSNEIKERLDSVFEEYGVRIEFFNIETIEVPDKDYQAISAAKERRSSRNIEGYSWQEQRQMEIAEKFPGNEGTLGAVGGAVSGFMVGGAFGSTMSGIAQQAFNPNNPGGAPMQGMNGAPMQGVNPGYAPNAYAAPGAPVAPEPTVMAAPPEAAAKFCISCGAQLVDGAMFCPKCGTKQDEIPQCKNCGKQLAAGQAFCPYCGTKV